ncbi:MAG TPA: serine acetyltransferase [Acidimicrobiia bacterium]|nr:serine acetyltransferase [Acidimicrobiia bacterium]
MPTDTPEPVLAPPHAPARRVALLVRMAWYVPMLVGMLVTNRRAVVRADVARWVAVVRPACPRGWELVALLGGYPEFRTLYCYRLRRGNLAGAALARVLAVVYPGERTLHLACSEIGPGLFIQHGFATIVAASRVGANCWINQQVTIGFDRPGARPVLGDGVSVHAGAKVLGAVTVGDGARIGANAVVLHDVPAGSTAVGVPARILPPKAQRAGHGD